MIRTFGLFWKKERVYWGVRGQGGAGTLFGTEKPGDDTPPVDFKDQRGIYALYSEFELVYVGQTGAGNQRLLARLRNHLSDHLAERWDRFSWFGTRFVRADHTLSADAAHANTETTVALDVMEAVSIAIAEPRLNLRRGKWKSSRAKQFFQVSSEEPDVTE